MASDLDSYQTYRAAMGFKPRPASPLEPAAAARKGPAQPVEPPALDERSLVLNCFLEIILALMDLIERCGEDRRGCEALIRVLWTVKQREFDLRLEKPNK